MRSTPTLNYKSLGEGNPVIILHGLFGMLDNWQSFAQALSQTQLVFIIDQRDHGKSPHTDQFNYHLLAEDLRHFMETHWIYKATLIGHSMGGKAAMQFAIENNDMVDRLIIVDIAPKAYHRGHDNILNALYNLDLDQVASRQDITDILAKDIKDLSVVNFLMKNIKREKSGKYLYKFNFNLLYKEYDHINVALEFNDPIDIPTLFVRGEESDYISDEDFEDIQKKFSNVEISTIEGAGHWVHADQPAALLELVTTFVNS